MECPEKIGPVGNVVPCGGCGKSVDALRACVVKVINEHIVYFCSETCSKKHSFISLNNEIGASVEHAEVDVHSNKVAEEFSRASAEWSEPIRIDPPIEERVEERQRIPMDVHHLVALIAFFSGLITLGLALLPESTPVLVGRCVVAVVGVILILSRALFEHVLLYELIQFGSLVVSTLFAIGCVVVGNAVASSALTVNGTGIVALVFLNWSSQQLKSNELQTQFMLSKTIWMQFIQNVSWVKFVQRYGGFTMASAILWTILSGVFLKDGVAIRVNRVMAVMLAFSASIGWIVSNVYIKRVLLLLHQRGVHFRDAQSFDMASEVNMALFCARGTLLQKEPEVIDIKGETILDELRILSLAAAVERLEKHPIATAIVKAARFRKLALENTRNTNTFAGLGASAVLSSGEEVCVGNRTFLLQKRISIAAVEEPISLLESSGKIALLVSLGTKLAGYIVLQDGIRAGARAAVQHLLNVQIEPALMSGDSHATCDAIGRVLDIDHVRAEVTDEEQSAEIQRLKESGLIVAVIGLATKDESQLMAADVSVALQSSENARFSINVNSDNIRDATMSVALARRGVQDTKTALLLSLGPVMVGVLFVSLGIVDPIYVVIASVLGNMAVVMHSRRLDQGVR